LNLLTGDVEDVYYSESEGLTPSDIDTMKNDLENSASIASVKNDAVRYAAGIGYYGGAGSSAGADGDSSAVQPECTVVNKEDLYVKLTVPGLDNSVVENPKLISASVKVQGESHTVNSVAKRASQTFTAGGSEQLSETNKNLIASTDAGGTYTLYLLLDSMTDGKSFAGLCPDLVPGDDLTLSLTLKVNGRTIISDRSFAQVNSLFAAKTAESGAVTATYGYVRQLHNLAAYCNVSDTKRESMSGTAVTLRQMQDVDFAALSDKQQLDDGLIMPGNTAATSYAAASVTGAVSGVTLDGGGYVLKNFKITSDDYGYAGLIGSCSLPLKLQNLRVADAAVSGVYGAGTLAGMTQKDTQVSNCRVYLTQHADMSGWMTDHAVTYDTEFAGTAILGGLVGHSAAGTLTIENSCAAVPVTSNYIAGGLVGVSQQSVSVNNSYSSTSVKAKTIAAGFVGKVYKTANITNSFTTASVLSSDTGTSAMAAEFATASSAAVTLKNCTAYGLVSTKGTVTYGPLASGSSILPDATCVGLYQSGNTSVSAAYESSVTKKEFSELKTTGSGKTYPYLSTGTFPFTFLTYSLNGKTVTMPYYGDWPEEIKPVSSNTPYGLCYYEQYPLFAAALSKTPLSATEKQPLQVRTEGQLNELSDFKRGQGTYFLQTHNIPVSKKTTGLLDAGFSYTYDGGGNQITDLQQPLFNLVGSDSCVKNAVLQNVDIAGSGYYTAALALNAHGKVTDCRVISGSIRPSGDGWVGGLIANIDADAQITGCSVENITLNSSGVAAGLVGKAQGTVKNCYVSGAAIRENGNAASYAHSAAGLIGESDSGLRLQNCYAANSLIQSKKGDASGLISYVRGGTVFSCYANNTVSSEQADAAGFCASVQDTAHIYGCYSDGTVSAGNSANDKAAGFFLHGGSDGYVYGCYSAARIVNGKNSVGFGDYLWNSYVSNCYWAKEQGMNASVSGTVGTACSLTKLRNLLTLDSYFARMDDGNGHLIWSMDNQSHTHPQTLDGGYPYPRLATLDHYGDWPVSAGAGWIGAYSFTDSQSSNMNGESIDLSGNSGNEVYTHPGNTTGYGILIDDAIRQQADDWTVGVRWSYFGGYYQTVSKGELSSYLRSFNVRTVNWNGKRYLCYFQNWGTVGWFDWTYYVTVRDITFTYTPTGETYTFVNSDEQFAYAG
jgi:hypothetical protein